MTIETQRLILRPFRETDAEDVFEYLHQPAVNCFVDMKLDSLAQAKEKMRRFRELLKERSANDRKESE